MCAWHPHRERLVLADFREVVVVNGVVRLEFYCLELVQRCGSRDRIGGAPLLAPHS
jgi:hypothetical protein